jgi:hypothetical protein
MTLTDEERAVRAAAEAALERIDIHWTNSEAAQRAILRMEATLDEQPAWVRAATMQVLAKVRAMGEPRHV